MINLVGGASCVSGVAEGVQDNPYSKNMNNDLHYRVTLHSIKPQWRNLLNFDIVSFGIILEIVLIAAVWGAV